MKKSILLAFFLLLNGAYSWGQEIQLSQPYRANYLINPSLTGTVYQHRVMGHQRLQWFGLEGKYATTIIGYDRNFHKYNSGVGGYVYYDQQGPQVYTKVKVALTYSYRISLGHWDARLGLKTAYVSNRLNTTDLIYPDQITSYGAIVSSAESKGIYGRNFMDFDAGLMINNDAFWIGGAFQHLNRPNQSTFESYIDKIPLNYIVMTGYQFVLNKGTAGEDMQFETSISPTMMYKFLGKSDQYDAGVYAMIRGHFLTALWYRGIPFKNYSPDLINNESVILLAGWRFNGMSITYSYDAVVSTLKRASPKGAHELNIAYTFPKERTRGYKRMPCPEFD